MKSKDWVLSLDIGTSSCRAMAFDARGHALARMKAQVHYSPRTEPPGAAIFDAEALVGHVAACLDDLLGRAASEGLGAPAAVGVTTFWHSMVGVDAQGTAITPLYTWADTRADAVIPLLRDRLSTPNTQSKIQNPKSKMDFLTPDTHSRTGCALHSSYFPARLLWLSQAEPELLSNVRQWQSPGEYLFQQLFGAARCSVSMASATGLFNQNACDWDDATLDRLPEGSRRLAPLTDLDAPASGLRPAWAKRWPALKEVPWVPAIGDGAASNVGTGCATAERIAINLGTSGAIRVLWEAGQVEIPPELWCYRLDRRRFVMGGAFSDGGDVYAWMRRTLALPDEAAIAAYLAQATPGSHGLTFLPFLAGERSIGWRPDATASLYGLRQSTTPLQILQAAMEGVALRFVLVADILQRVFPQARELRASGNALGQSPAWAQMLCDALGQPLLVSEESEASSRGAALVALRAAGLLSDEANAPLPESRLLEPNLAYRDYYRQVLERQQELYGQTRTIEEKA